MAAKKVLSDDILEPTPVKEPAPKREAGYHVKEGCQRDQQEARCPRS